MLYRFTHVTFSSAPVSFSLSYSDITIVKRQIFMSKTTVDSVLSLSLGTMCCLLLGWQDSLTVVPLPKAIRRA